MEGVYPFGVGVFRKLTLQLSRIPQQQRHVPANYVLGSGDQLRIHAWNESQDQTLSVEISQKGTIQFPLAGELFLRGVKKSDLNDYLKQSLSKYFKNLNVSSELTVLRQFPVYVTGEVRLPGAYVATALSTPIQLLMASGGIQSNGSLREVQILRDGKLIGKVDLYDFLMSGRINEKVLFKSGDVLHVPLAERNVAVLGKVRRPAIGIEARFFDRDGLDGGPTAGFKALSECIEIDWPMCDANCFEHFDRHDLIKEAIDISIVLQTDIDLVGETGLCHPGARILGLFR